MKVRKPGAMVMRGVVAAAVLSCAAAGQGAVTRAQGLEGRINGLLGSPLVKGALISLDVVEVTPRGPVEVYGHNATMPLGPASNCKLLTTSAAFERYGAKASFKTVLYKVGEDLVVVGGGDPGLGDAKLLDPDSPNGTRDVTAPFEKWAEALKKAGVTHYRNLVIDDRVFDQHWKNAGWPAKDAMDWYCAPIGGLNFNDNCLEWIPHVEGNDVSVELVPPASDAHIEVKASRGNATRVWVVRSGAGDHYEMRGTVSARGGGPGTEPFQVPVWDPGMWTGSVVKGALAAAGIEGSGEVRRVGETEKLGAGQLIATAETPLMEVIRRANKNSINMMAECLCKRLGHDTTGQPGSWENGTAAVEAFVTSLGVDRSWLHLDDGSGLSNKNRVAAKAFTTVLAHVASGKDGNVFVDSLAIPGEDGTLKRRFRGMSVAKVVHAKTGHISGVSTLSGYIDVNRKDGSQRRFAFSILCNKYQGNVNPWQDQVCQAIYEWALGR